MEIGKKLADDCKVTENASDEDVKELMEHETPTSTTGKCLHACIHENIGLVSNMMFCLEL